MAFDVPVVLLAYNRPDLTSRVFQVLSEVKPATLFVSVDGPRDSSDVAECQEVRRIVSNPTWTCKLQAAFANVNLGCARRVSSYLDYVFQRVDNAIVIEDDCLPTPDFFTFCREVLTAYKSDSEVMHIAGTNLLTTTSASSKERSSSDYFFSRFCLPPWGWATWRRAWSSYRFDTCGWLSEKHARNSVLRSEFLSMWDHILERNHRERFTWDLQWNLALWKKDGLAVVPYRNLVSNIGFDERATLTRIPESSFAGKVTSEWRPPLRHPADKSVLFDMELETCLMQLFREILDNVRIRDQE